MAERRMFAKTIIDSDAFLDMPLSTQALYFHLSMRADDDGFINNPKKIQRVVGASEDDLKVLLAKGFLIPFESGIVVIKHWRIHNYIQSDRYKRTVYLEEKKMLDIKENKAYTLKNNEMDTRCIHDGYSLEAQVRLGKDSIGKVSKDKTKHFTKPTVEEIKAYCLERHNNVDADKFYNYYESNGWMVGRNKMKDWKASVRTWERNNYDKPKTKNDDLLDMIDPLARLNQ